MTDKYINKAAYKQAALQIAAGIRRLERADKYLLKEDAWAGCCLEDAWASCCLWEALMQAKQALDYVRKVQNGIK